METKTAKIPVSKPPAVRDKKNGQKSHQKQIEQNPQRSHRQRGHLLRAEVAPRPQVDVLPQVVEPRGLGRQRDLALRHPLPNKRAASAHKPQQKNEKNILANRSKLAFSATCTPLTLCALPMACVSG